MKNRYLQFRLFIKAHTAKKNCKTFGNIILFSLLCSRNLTTNERNPSGNCVKVILENGKLRTFSLKNIVEGIL
jgi:hypothetical protein